MGALTHNGEVLQSLPANASQINFDKTGTNLNSTQTEAAIKEVNGKVNTNTADINQLKSGLTNLSTITGVSNLFEMDDTKVVNFNAAKCGNILSLYGRVHGLTTNTKIGSFPAGLRVSIKSACIITDYNTGSPVSGNIFITPGSADIKYYGTTFADDAEFSATIMVEAVVN